MVSDLQHRSSLNIQLQIRGFTTINLHRGNPRPIQSSNLVSTYPKRGNTFCGVSRGKRGRWYTLRVGLSSGSDLWFRWPLT